MKNIFKKPLSRQFEGVAFGALMFFGIISAFILFLSYGHDENYEKVNGRHIALKNQLSELRIEQTWLKNENEYLKEKVCRHAGHRWVYGGFGEAFCTTCRKEIKCETFWCEGKNDPNPRDQVGKLMRDLKFICKKKEEG